MILNQSRRTLRAAIARIYIVLMLFIASCAPAPDPNEYSGSWLEDAQHKYSIGDYGSALDIYESAGHHSAELDPLINARIQYGLGNTFRKLCRYEDSISAYSLAIELFSSETPERSAVYQARGISFRKLGRHSEAEKDFRAAVDLLVGTQSTSLVMAYGNLGAAYLHQGNYAQALDTYQDANRILVGNTNSRPTLRARIQTDIGMTRVELGDYIGGLADFETALSLIEGEPAHKVRGRIHHHTGYAYFRQGELESNDRDVEKSIEQYRAALSHRKQANDKAGQGRTLNNLGYSQAYLGEYTDANSSLLQALEIARLVRDKNSEARTLDSIGKVSMYLSNYPAAEKYFFEALIMSKEIGDRGLEHVTLANLGRVYLQEDKPALAIVFLKTSVDVIEEIRRDLNQLPASTKKFFADSVADTYRLLADVLLDQKRPLEAENVIDLLRIEEATDYVEQIRSDDSELTILQGEKEVIDEYSKLLAEAIRLARDYARISKTPRQKRTNKDKERLDTIIEEQQAIDQKFIQFKDSPEVKKALKRNSIEKQLADVQLDNLITLAEMLKPNEILFYPFILPDRLELIYATSKSVPINFPVNVSEETLNNTVTDFRQALKGRSRKVIELAQQLYQWMLSPLDDAIAELNLEDNTSIDTIVYIPDGILRYIPLAALHDGTDWIAKKYRSNIITARSLRAFDESSSEIVNVLAGGFTNARSVTESDGKVRVFKALPYAGTEVEDIKNLYPNAEVYVEGDFTHQTFLSAFRDFQVVHLATHGVFTAGKSLDYSYIVFGDGGRATLSDVQSWLMQNVELVVLSACETGIGGELKDGKEIHGFGYLVQTRGADAVIASLWKVSDGGTQALMSTFYRYLKEPNMSKAKALQEAQLAMIENRLDSDVESLIRGPRPVGTTYTPPGFEHPFFWAPFVLIGNGR